MFEDIRRYEVMGKREELQEHYEAVARANADIEMKRVEIEAMEKRRRVGVKLNGILSQLDIQPSDDPLDVLFVYRGYPDLRPVPVQPTKKVYTGHGQVKRKGDKRIGVWKHVWKGHKLVRVRLGDRE